MNILSHCGSDVVDWTSCIHAYTGMIQTNNRIESDKVVSRGETNHYGNMKPDQIAIFVN